MKKMYFIIHNKFLLMQFNAYIYVFWSSVVALVIYGNLPSKWTNISNEMWLAIHSVAPQHWIFTEIDVHRPQLTIYQVAADGSLILYETRPMNAEYKFGLNRQSRVKQSAFSQIAGSFPDQNWTTLNIEYGHPPVVDGDTFKFMNYSHPSTFPPFCGRFVLKRQSPLEPSKFFEKTRPQLPASILGIEILCT